MEQIYKKIEERNDVISSAGCLKLELVHTREQNIAAENIYLLLANMFLKALLYVRRYEPVVYDVNIDLFEKVLIGRKQASNVYICVEKQIIKLKVIVNEACLVDFLEDV